MNDEWSSEEPVNPWTDPALVQAMAGLNALVEKRAGEIGSYELRAVDTTGAKLYLVINADGGLRDGGPSIARSSGEALAMVRAYRRGLEDGHSR